MCNLRSVCVVLTSSFREEVAISHVSTFEVFAGVLCLSHTDRFVSHSAIHTATAETHFRAWNTRKG